MKKIFWIVGWAILLVNLFSFVKEFRGDLGDCETKDLIDNYEERLVEIAGLKTLMEDLVPGGYGVGLKIHKNDLLDFKVWKVIDSINYEKVDLFEKKYFDPNNYKEDKSYLESYSLISLENVLEELMWNGKEFKRIKKKLVDANCLKVKKEGDIMEIEFRETSKGIYSYKILKGYSETDLKSSYNDGCNSRFYKENIVLKFEGKKQICMEDI